MADASLFQELLMDRPEDLMTPPDHFDPPPLEEPLAHLERELMRAYVAGAGYDLHELLQRDDADARAILARASQHVAGRLAEVESRLHYVRHMRGEP
jgi:hypothetical protein